MICEKDVQKVNYKMKKHKKMKKTQNNDKKTKVVNSFLINCC